jgi:hypothetical protein
MSIGEFSPWTRDFGIVPLGPSPLGGDIHESFNVDEFGNIRRGHTTVQIPGGKKFRKYWDDDDEK